MKIAITGGIGCGKSTVSKYLRERGANVFCADSAAHRALEVPQIVAQLVERWGDEIRENAGVSRAKIGNIVFNAPEELKFLETIIHREVRRQMEPVLAAEGDVFCDVPLLYEAGMEDMFDAVIAVWSPEAMCRARLANWPRGDYSRRAKLQMPPEKKLERADFALINNDSCEQLYAQCEQLMGKLGIKLQQHKSI